MDPEDVRALLAPYADEQLQRAFAFFRSVGATQRIREAEALLPASA